MIKVELYKNQKVAVFGLGRSGNGSVRALSDGGAEVLAWDDNESSRTALVKENYANVKISDPKTYNWKEIKALILSPGVPLTHPEPHYIVNLAKSGNCPIICDIELLVRSVPEAKFVGITGTNGKSTTTALTGHILKNAGIKTEVGGNIGISALALSRLEKKGVYVLEVSSFQLDLIDKAKFDVSLLLNITPDHIDRHGDMHGYIKAKKRIFMNQEQDSAAIIGVDTEETKHVFEELKLQKKIGKIIPISNMKKVDGVYVVGGKLSNEINNDGFDIGELKHLRGTHNWQNIAAAYTICYLLGVKKEKIVDGIISFPGLKHRIEIVEEINGIPFINDSKATNAEAAEKAILCFENIYWIAGGIAKDGGIKPLEKYFSRIKHAFLIGKAEEEFAETLKGKVEFTKCGDLKNATELAAKMAFLDKSTKKPVVLLSPACASFDQWKNFEERGRASA